MIKNLKDYIIITIGVLLVACGLYFFMMQNNIAAGGISGLAMVLNHYMQWLPVGGMMFIIDGVLFVVAFIVIGPDFGGRTIYSSLLLSTTTLMLEKFVPMKNSLTGDMFMEMIFGIIISAIGLAIIFNKNASTGGTDIVAKILNKYFQINMGKGVLMADLVVVALAMAAFGLRQGLYALFAVILNGMVIDRAIEGLNACKQVKVISDKYLEVQKFILEDLGRGATVYSATGSFSQSDVKVLETVVSTKEFIKIKNYIKSIDTNAFVIVSDVHETLGEGFKSIVH